MQTPPFRTTRLSRSAASLVAGHLKRLSRVVPRASDRGKRVEGHRDTLAATPFIYILRCADETRYVGHTDHLRARERVHNSHAAAIRRERQLKRWSGKKKEALMAGDLTTMKRLSRRRLATQRV